MEHLLRPRGVAVLPSEKAALVAEAYDGGPFMDYPERSRFQDLYESIVPKENYYAKDKQYGASTMREIEVFVQTWLVFGLLHEVLGDCGSAEDFVSRNEDGKSALLSTADLPLVVDRWVDKAHDFGSQPEGKELLEHLLRCILKAHQLLNILRHKPNFANAIKWTTASIVETLESVVLETLDGSTRSLPTVWQKCYDSVDIVTVMKENNWCPADIAKWRAASGGLQTLYFLSKMKQPFTKDHSGCVGAVCVAHQYDMSGQSAMHRQAGCTCNMLQVDNQALLATFEEGHMGLLDIRGESEPDSMTIDVVSSKGDKQYVALSHVWADGLGNPAANALPRCQLAHVARIVKKLEQASGGPLILWLDTLCCPTTSPPHRQQCLLRMRDIYSQASHVLVLDAHLSYYNAGDLDSVEVCARLMFSGWTRRLWTLQEGALARKLWVQLKDRPVDMDAVESDVAQIYRERYIHNQLTLILISALKRLRKFGRHRQTRARDLLDVSMALQSRSVSVAADEAICLTLLMDIEQERVVSASQDRRMEAFWRSMESAKTITQ